MKKWNIENLEALRVQYDGSKSFGAYQAYINGLEFELAKALEQPAQESVEVGTSGTAPLPKIRYESYQWQGLSDDEIKHIVCGNAGATALFYMLKDDVIGSDYKKCIESFARAIEQALKEKNG